MKYDLNDENRLHQDLGSGLKRGDRQLGVLKKRISGEFLRHRGFNVAEQLLRCQSIHPVERILSSLDQKGQNA